MAPQNRLTDSDRKARVVERIRGIQTDIGSSSEPSTRTEVRHDAPPPLVRPVHKEISKKCIREEHIECVLGTALGKEGRGYLARCAEAIHTLLSEKGHTYHGNGAETYVLLGRKRPRSPEKSQDESRGSSPVSEEGEEDERDYSHLSKYVKVDSDLDEVEESSQTPN